METASRVRWSLLALLVVSIFINYIDRSNLSISVTNIEKELSLDDRQAGLLLSGFFWTYALFQLAAGWLVDRYNVYWVYAAGFLVWSAATALTGFAGGFGVLFGLRLVLGTGESIAYPAYSRIITDDFPERRRGLANALIDAGSKAGPALGTLLGGLIVARFGWRPLFFVLGFGALVWLVPWVLAIPRRVPGQPRTRSTEGGPGFMEIASKRDAWGTFLVMFGANYAWYFILTWVPAYLEKERGFSKDQTAVFGSLPFWGLAGMAVLAGWASDRLIAGGCGTSRVRKSFAVAGLLLTTLILPASMLANHGAATTLLTVGCLSYGLYSSNVWAITQTLAGPGAGKWTGMQNCIGNLAGVAAPYATGLIKYYTGHFFLAFAAACFWLVVAAGSYLFIVGRVEPVRWRARGSTGSVVLPSRGLDN
jgi:ACS family D-galactonate transporter-like MFS transporter